MLFNSTAFLLFALIFFPLYFASRGTIKNVVLVTASYFSMVGGTGVFCS